MNDPSPFASGGRSALERLAADLSARDAERETRERLRVARAEARRDHAAAAIDELRAIIAELWSRIAEVVPMAMLYSQHRLELEQGMLEWDIEHDVVPEGAFERSGWDVAAGAWLRLHQRDSVYDYPGRSTSLWYAKLPGDSRAWWYEVAYNAAEGNAPAEEPFALKDLIKADMVASDEPSNLFHAVTPARLDDAGVEAFHDRWMGLLARAAAGELERPAPTDHTMEADPADGSVGAGGDAGGERRSDNSIIGRLRGLS